MSGFTVAKEFHREGGGRSEDVRSKRKRYWRRCRHILGRREKGRAKDST